MLAKFKIHNIEIYFFCYCSILYSVVQLVGKKNKNFIRNKKMLKIDLYVGSSGF